MTRLASASMMVLLALAFVGDAHAKAYRAPLPEAERRIHAVAIVETAGISDLDRDDSDRGYRKLVQGDVLDVVAGTLPHRIEILGSLNFVCAPVAWKDRTRYLALLEHFGEHWVATNNEWGRIEIVDGMVAWPYDDTNELVPVEAITAMLAARLEDRLGRGRFAGEEQAEPEEIEPVLVVATPPAVEAPAAVEDSSPAPWIALGAAAVVFGFVVGTRRRR